MVVVVPVLAILIILEPSILIPKNAIIPIVIAIIVIVIVVIPVVVVVIVIVVVVGICFIVIAISPILVIIIAIIATIIAIPAIAIVIEVTTSITIVIVPIVVIAIIVIIPIIVPIPTIVVVIVVVIVVAVVSVIGVASVVVGSVVGSAGVVGLVAVHKQLHPIFGYYYNRHYTHCTVIIQTQYINININIIDNHNRMLSFGQAKNSLEKLKSYLKKMEYFESTKNNHFSVREMEEQNLRQYHNQIFLPLLNFMLIDYCTDIYIDILNRLPNIKYKDDRNFVEDVLNIGRDLFKCNVPLTADQFLTNKYFQKKLEFLSNLAKAVYDKAEAIRKLKAKDKDKDKDKDKQVYPNTAITEQYKFIQQFDDFEEEEEVPMVITAQPMRIDVDEFKQKHTATTTITSNRNKQPIANDKKQGKTNMPKTVNNRFYVNGEQFNEWEVQRALEQRHPTPVRSATSKPTQQPVQITDRSKIPRTPNYPPPNEYQPTQQLNNNDDDEEEDSKYDRFRLDHNRNTVKSSSTNSRVQSHQLKQRQEEEMQDRPRGGDSGEYVSRKEFNQLVGLVKIVSQAVNQISGKFGVLEANVDSHINNMNARIMMLESSVRLLKDNL